MSSQPGLPKHFVNSMRTLFDIMDDRKCGYVKFSEIESRWKDDETKRLPRGVLECLSKVTPPNGLLSFERFCAGLKICLLRNRVDQHHQHNNDNQVATPPPPPPPLPPTTTILGTNNSNCKIKRSVPSQIVSPTINPTTTSGSSAVRPNDNGSSYRDCRQPGDDFVIRSVPVSPSKTGADHSGYRSSNANTATVRPNLSLQQRALSMPLLGDNKLAWSAEKEGGGGGGVGSSTGHLSGPDVGAIYGQHPNSYPANTNLGARAELRGYRSETIMPSTATRGQQQGPSDPSNHRPNQPIGSERVSLSRGAAGTGIANTARNRRGIMTVLHNWHLGLLNDAAADHRPGRSVHFKVDASMKPATSGVAVEPPPKPPHLGQQQLAGGRPLFPDKSHNIGIDHDQYGGGAVSDGDVNTSINKDTANNFRRGHPRRREPRRHTLANGIDYNMLKRMKQLEQEKDVLLQGREAVERARSWYAKQILGVQEKMKYIGQSNGHLEYSTEAHQERLNFQMAQIFEANQHLSNLVESSERGFPIHMNLAVRQPSMYTAKAKATPAAGGAVGGSLHQLKEINHLLSEEVSKKSERIAQLEKEKAALVRELFQARSQGRREIDDTTLM